MILLMKRTVAISLISLTSAFAAPTHTNPTSWAINPNDPAQVYILDESGCVIATQYDIGKKFGIKPITMAGNTYFLPMQEINPNNPLPISFDAWTPPAFEEQTEEEPRAGRKRRAETEIFSQYRKKNKKAGSYRKTEIERNAEELDSADLQDIEMHDLETPEAAPAPIIERKLEEPEDTTVASYTADIDSLCIGLGGLGTLSDTQAAAFVAIEIPDMDFGDDLFDSTPPSGNTQDNGISAADYLNGRF